MAPLIPLSPEREAALPGALIEDMRMGKVVALVGAGLSIGAKFPSWRDLLRRLCEQIFDEVGNDDEVERLMAKAGNAPEWVAEVLQQHSPDAYLRVLRNIFADYPAKEISPTHALLAALPFRGFLTTNYEHLIEDYVGVLDATPPFILTPFQEENLASFLRQETRFVLKLHGCASRDVGRLVLASSDYFDILRNPSYERVLAHIFQQYTVLTLGFGLADRDLMRFVEERRDLYGNKCPRIFSIFHLRM